MLRVPSGFTLDILCANKGCSLDPFPDAFGEILKSEPTPILNFLTNFGFLGLSDNFVTRLLKNEWNAPIYGEEIDRNILAAPKVLDCTDAEAIRRIDRKMESLEKCCEYQEVVTSEEFHDLQFEQYEKEQAMEAYVQVEKTQLVRKTFKEQYTDRVRKIFHKAGKKVKLADGAVKKPLKKKKKIEACPTPADDNAFTVDEILALAPMNTMALKDYFNGRWRLYWRVDPTWGWKDISRSWGRRSSFSAAMLCLQSVWMWAELYNIVKNAHTTTFKNTRSK